MTTVLLGSHRPGGTDESNMPPGLEEVPKNYGRRTVGDTMVLVRREPRMHRISEDTEFCFRTSWIRTTKGWKQIENRIKWTKLSVRTARISEWFDRGVFVFEKTIYPAVSAPKETMGDEGWEELFAEAPKSKIPLRIVRTTF